MRDRLLAEHLGVGAEEVAAAVAAHGGSLLGAVEDLRRDTGRSLQPFQPPRQGLLDTLLADTELLDPEQTPSRVQRVVGRVQRRGHRRLRA